MGLKENGIRASGVALMGAATRASWNQYDVGGRGMGNRLMFGMYVSRPPGYYEKAMFLPFSLGGLAVRLAGEGTQTAPIEATGALASVIPGSCIPVFNGNEGWHIFANLSGQGVIGSANPNDSRGSLECSVQIGAQPSAVDIAQAVWGQDRTSLTDTTKFGGFVQKLLTMAKFIGLK